MSKNFDFHLFICLRESTVKKVLEDIGTTLEDEQNIKEMMPNYDFKSLKILKKRFLYYQKKYSKIKENPSFDKTKVLEEINQLLNKDNK